jgi:hypothetical protein
VQDVGSLRAGISHEFVDLNSLGCGRSRLLLPRTVARLYDVPQPPQGLEVATPNEQVGEGVEEQAGEPIAGILDHGHARASGMRLEFKHYVGNSQRPRLGTQAEAPWGVALEHLGVVGNLQEREANPVIEATAYGGPIAIRRPDLA